jgi:hypothetical protein
MPCLDERFLARSKPLLSVGVLYRPSETPGQPSIRVTFATNATTPYLVH